jgi:hypothetical protein
MSSASSVSIFFGFRIQMLPAKAIIHNIPNTFHVRNGPNGQFRGGDSSSLPANSLHRNPEMKGAKAREKAANPWERPFKAPSVSFDGALFVI